MRSLFINTTHGCNLNCTYCYEKDFSLPMQIVNIEHVKKLMRLAAEYSQEVNILFHGGEPLMLPVSFYKEIKEYGYSLAPARFYYSMQSNATLLNEENIELFTTQHNPFGIGVSYDGLSNYKHRCPNKMVTDKIELLAKHGVQFGIITVANKDYLENIFAEYEHLKELAVDKRDFGAKVNWIFGSAASEKYNRLYVQSMCELFDYWIQDPEPVRIDQFMELVGMYFNQQHLITHACLNCHQHWVGMDVDGLIGMCDFGVYPRELSFGHIDEINDLAEVKFHPKRLQLMAQLSRRHQLCYQQRCPLIGKCTGGCNGRIYRDHSDLGQLDAQHCFIMRSLYAHASDRLSNIRIEKLNPLIHEVISNSTSCNCRR